MGPSEKYLSWVKEQLNKEKEVTTPSQEINKLTDELLRLNPQLTVHWALTNSLITYLDILASRANKSNEIQYPENKHVDVKDNTLKSTMDALDVKVTVETAGRKLVLDVPYDSDIFVWEQKLNILLKWLTFQPQTINLILGSQEGPQCNCND